MLSSVNLFHQILNPITKFFYLSKCNGLPINTRTSAFIRDCCLDYFALGSRFSILCQHVPRRLLWKSFLLCLVESECVLDRQFKEDDIFRERYV